MTMQVWRWVDPGRAGPQGWRSNGFSGISDHSRRHWDGKDPIVIRPAWSVMMPGPRFDLFAVTLARVLKLRFSR